MAIVILYFLTYESTSCRLMCMNWNENECFEIFFERTVLVYGEARQNLRRVSCLYSQQALATFTAACFKYRAPNCEETSRIKYKFVGPARLLTQQLSEVLHATVWFILHEGFLYTISRPITKNAHLVFWESAWNSSGSLTLLWMCGQMLINTRLDRSYGQIG